MLSRTAFSAASPWALEPPSLEATLAVRSLFLNVAMYYYLLGHDGPAHGNSSSHGAGWYRCLWLYLASVLTALRSGGTGARRALSHAAQIVCSCLYPVNPHLWHRLPDRRSHVTGVRGHGITS